MKATKGQFRKAARESATFPDHLFLLTQPPAFIWRNTND